MSHRFIRGRAVILSVLLFVSLLGPSGGVRAAEPFADLAFQALWGRTDGAVATSAVQRTFLWGPAPLTPGVQEKYAQSPGGTRLVQYFDKSRMEITNPGAAASTPFYVTNGLLVTELMTGRIQTGNDPSQVDVRDPANINVVGDGADPNAPTYQTLAKLRDLPARAVDASVKESVDRGGAITNGGPDGVTVAVLVPETRHAVASVFWSFMNSGGPVSDGAGGTTNAPLFANPFYATGYPVTEAYWTTVRVGGAARQVLMQAFERRVLTFTPGNPRGFEVEAGNVGAHYYQWRYVSRTGTVVDPSSPIGPYTIANVFAGKYNVPAGDVPSTFRTVFEGEVSNDFLSRNDTDANYATYLRQWQRVTGYRRAFSRVEANSQVSGLQSIISVFRTQDGALAAYNFNHDRLKNQQNTVLTEGPVNGNSYLAADHTNDPITRYSLVWVEGNVLASLDLSSPHGFGLTVSDLLDLAGKIHRRLAADLTPATGAATP